MGTKLAELRKKKKSKKGFTLVELVIVIAVLAIIAGIATFTVQSVVKNANASADKSNAQAIEMALKTFESENAAYSETKSANVKALLTPDSGTDEAGNDTVASPYKNKVTDILKQYGVDPEKVGLGTTNTKLKEGSDYHYYRDNNLGTVIILKNGDTVPTDYHEITDNSKTYKITSGKVDLT